ncbi:hypothetical protein [Clostridium beijerinckii]|uniref:hypothetical protein n=1 Tax=Clostridium beijerinckii TaxID=1520 RepID=UPI0004262986|nr:hypothetical protein [Clostridium beijerinckii]MZK53434.1 hypothetical protein [Clostridium beijerinckii]MZK61539.1 hypothetical protein [Clostridium beijerinckii]MZK71781.1 hypothetical protein [Clostridium beijerinckii]MZK77176.1 hypothetical protein [Clostridium beijerinckii]MZK86829.1 hypothetical protein [Clostridium beijerinckii]
MKKNKIIKIMVYVIGIITIAGLVYWNIYFDKKKVNQNSDKAVVNESELKKEDEEESKKEYTEFVTKTITEKFDNSKVTYDKSSDTIYITNYGITIGNIDDLLNSYINSDDEGKNKIKQSLNWDDIVKSNMDLYNTLKEDQAKYSNISMGIRIILNNTISEADKFPHILIVENGEIIKDVFQSKVDEHNKELANSTPQNVTSNYKALHGKLLEANKLGKTLTVKFKIEPSMRNKLTIDQNGFNVEDLILNQGGDQFDTISYWAVADMEDGSEGKVISFTLNKELIKLVKKQTILGNQIVDKASNVWILPSLKN